MRAHPNTKEESNPRKQNHKSKSYLEHVVGSFANGVNVSEGEPLAESGAYLEEASQHKERLLLIDCGYFRDVVLCKCFLLGRTKLENIARVLGKVILHTYSRRQLRSSDDINPGSASFLLMFSTELSNKFSTVQTSIVSDAESRKLRFTVKYLAPLKTIVHAWPISTPEKWISLSSPIMISSISLQCPSLTDSGLSKVDAISPPVTKARRSIPSKSACSIARIPASAKSSSGKL
nr:hypothetical protein Itr_chr01CG23360 [Ipomoea trifida]